VRRAGLQPTARVAGIDPAADLKSTRKCGQRGAGFGLVAGTELDDVAARKAVAPVKSGKPRRRAVGNEICPHTRTTQRAADNLLHFAFMQVNAGTKHVSKLNSHRENAH
jgi:hypothetical protein